ncbi:cytochrome c oxidase subunit 3 [Roseibacillus persicicus]|uniref:cytochrome c oxidase subunit 3 n=1 Tax=Roseibacillus persicicus TaxID=454148 RepID=UPI00398BA8B8
MDIPYTVTARKDTGLYNAKVGIWLFLASEVMLFGGLFSGYVFLRVYADFPWPERALPVVPGLINTFILIGSSVTIVFAWAALKMRKWRQFQVFMIITLLCAGLFMVLKGIEYKAKWSHQAVRMKDFVVIEGHTHKATIDNTGHIHHYHPEGEHGEKGHAAIGDEANGMILVAAEGDSHGEEGHHSDEGLTQSEPFEFNRVVFKADSVTVDLEKFYDPVIRDLMKQAQDQGKSIVLTGDLYGRSTHEVDEELLASKGDLLSLGMLKKLRAVHLDAKAHNAAIKTKQNRKAWAQLRGSLPKDQKGAPSYKIKGDLVLDEEFNKFLVSAPSSVRFEIMDAAEEGAEKTAASATFVLKPREVREGAESSSLRDGTLLEGELDAKNSQIEMAADAIDFRFVAQRAVEKGIDPEVAIQNTWLIKNNPEVKELWAEHKSHIDKLAKELEKHGFDKNGKPKQFPTDTERYRMGWQELVNMGEGKEVMGVFSGFAGPNHKKDYAKHFPEIVVPREETNLESKFTPRWNNYYAIYFLITGLHGLHVIGGALVLGHFLFCGKKMYLNNPERLANRVEVGGLFWHFVDLVWIFLFPILYLM